MARKAGHMRLGTEPVGRLGLAILAVTGVIGVVLAVHGWSARGSGLPKTTLGAGGSAKPTISPSTTVSPTTGSPTAGPSAASPAPNPSADHRPLLSAQPYASAAFLVWPGTPSAAA